MCLDSCADRIAYMFVVRPKKKEDNLPARSEGACRYVLSRETVLITVHFTENNPQYPVYSENSYSSYERQSMTVCMRTRHPVFSHSLCSDIHIIGSDYAREIQRTDLLWYRIKRLILSPPLCPVRQTSQNEQSARLEVAFQSGSQPLHCPEERHTWQIHLPDNLQV